MGVPADAITNVYNGTDTAKFKRTPKVTKVARRLLPYFLIVCVWPFGLLDYGSAMLRCKIGSLPFLGLRPHALHLAQSKERKGSNFAIWQPSDESAETGGCDEEKVEDDKKVVEDVYHDDDEKLADALDHESEKEPIAVSADDLSAGEDMVTAEDVTDPGRQFNSNKIK